jgi:hypothetical protein
MRAVRPIHAARVFRAPVNGCAGDRHTKGPAKYLGYPVVELPEDKAREIADVLTKSADTSLKVSGQWWPRS